MALSKGWLFNSLLWFFSLSRLLSSAGKTTSADCVWSSMRPTIRHCSIQMKLWSWSTASCRPIQLTRCRYELKSKKMVWVSCRVKIESNETYSNWWTPTGTMWSDWLLLNLSCEEFQPIGWLCWWLRLACKMAAKNIKLVKTPRLHRGRVHLRPKVPAKTSVEFDNQIAEQRQSIRRQPYTSSDSIVACISAPAKWGCILGSTAPDTPYTTATNTHNNSCKASSMCSWTARDTVTSHWCLFENKQTLYINSNECRMNTHSSNLPLADLYPYKSLICGNFCIKHKTIVMMLSTSATTSRKPFFI